MRFGIALSLISVLTLSLFVACSKSPEEKATIAARLENPEVSALAVLAEKKVDGTCYVSLYLWYLKDDHSVAATAVALANTVKDDWILISYNQEFNSRRTAIFKNKAC